jgi:hypothetical protein
MKRIWLAATFCVALSGAPASVAQTVEQSAAASCPSEPMSVYFASGETALSDEGRLLVGRLVEHAVACRPDGIDIITRINSGVDGDRAVTLALTRLSDLSQDFVSRGVPPDSIRVAAHPGDDIFPPGMCEVEVIFRKAPVGAGDAASRKPAAPRQTRVPSDAI